METINIDATAATETRAAFTVELQAMRAAVDFLAKRITERRNTIPMLSHVAVHAGPDGVQLVGNDLDVMASLDVAASVESMGSFTVDVASLADCLRKMPKGSIVSLADIGGKIALSSGRARMNLSSLPVDDFPILASPTGAIGHRFTLSAEWARDFAAVAPAMSTEETRYYLRGVLLQAFDDRLAIVATNGNFMAVVDRPAPDGCAGMPDSIVPRKTVAALLALAKGREGEPLSVEIDQSRVSFAAPGFCLVSKLIDGTFPDWRKSLEQIGEAAPEPVAIPFLDPRLPLDQVAKLEKGCGLPLAVEKGGSVYLLTAAGYPEFFGVVMSLTDSGAGKAKGFDNHRDANAERMALDYLRELATKAGLNFLVGADDEGAGGVRPHWAQGESEPRMTGATFGKVIEFGAYSCEAREIVDWETLSTSIEYVEHREPDQWKEGSFSIAMPGGRYFDHRALTLSVESDDGSWTPATWIAQDARGTCVLNADAVRHLAGPVDPSTFVHIPKVTFWRGQAVAVDGVPTDAMPEGYELNSWLPDAKEAKAMRARLALLNPRFDMKAIAEISARFDPICKARDERALRISNAVAAGHDTAEAEREADEAMQDSQIATDIAPIAEIPEPASLSDELAPAGRGEAVAAAIIDAGGDLAREAVASGRMAIVAVGFNRPQDDPEPVEAVIMPEPDAIAPGGALTGADDAVEAPEGDWVCDPCAYDAQPSETIGQLPVDPIAELTARVAALEALLRDRAGDTPIREAEAPAAEKVTESYLKPKRSLAHVRAIMRYMTMRKERAEYRDLWLKHREARNDADDRAKELQYQNTVLTAQSEGHETRWIEASNREYRTRQKRRRAVLFARDLQKRLNAEHRLVDKLTAAKRETVADLFAMRDKRKRAIIRARNWNKLAWQMTRAVDGVVIEHQSELLKARHAPTYFDEGHRERPDAIGAAFVHTVAERERADTLSGELATARATISTMAARIDEMGARMMDATGRALRAETALAAIDGRDKGYQPAVARVTFGQAA